MNINEFAKKLGISRTTVSHALSGKRYVSPKTVALIKEKIAEFGYEPNRNARRLALNRNYSIAFVCGQYNPFTSPYHSALASHLILDLKRNAYDIVLETFGDSPADSIDSFEKRLKNSEVDGCIVVGDRTLFEKIDFSGLACVWIDNVFNAPSQDCSTIFLDNCHAYDECLKLIQQKKIKNIGILARHPDHDPELDYLLKLLKKAEIMPPERAIAYSEESISAAAVKAAGLIHDNPTLELIFARTDFQSLGVMRTLHHLRKNVPGEIKVIGGNNTICSQLTDPEISTVGIDYAAISRTATDMILGMIEKGGQPPAQKTITSQLLLRGSF